MSHELLPHHYVFHDDRWFLSRSLQYQPIKLGSWSNKWPKFFYLRLVLRILVASGRWRHVGGLAIHLRRKSIVEGRAVALRLAIDRRSVVRGLLSAGFVVRRRSAWHLGPALMRGLVWCSWRVCWRWRGSLPPGRWWRRRAYRGFRTSEAQ